MAVPSSSSALTTPSHSRLHNMHVDARMFAAGDGTDETTTLQAAIDATPTNGTLFIPATNTGYSISSALTVTKAMTILSNGAKITQTGTSKKGLSITASGVTVDGLYLYGRQSAGAVASEHAIHIDGTDINGYVSNVFVRNCRIENWGFYGILAEFTKHFEFSGNRIYDAVYAGISVLSCHYGRIANNDIDMDGTTGSSSNAYGIAVSHNTPSNQADITNNPVSSDITVIGNLVQNNTVWEGIDTHAGERIVISGNEVYNCKIGIAAVPSDDAGGTKYWAPQDVSIVGNVVDSSETDGSAGAADYAGIVFVGAGSGVGTYQELGRGTIIGNIVRGHGLESSATSGGISCYFTEGMVLAGNTVSICSPTGINLYHTNYGFSVVGNTIVDPWTDTLSVATAIRLSSNSQTGFIAGNTARNGDLSGKTHILDRGVDCAGSTNMDVRLGVNHLAGATTPVVNAANVTSGLDEDTDGNLRVFSDLQVDGSVGIGAAPATAIEFQVRTDQNADTSIRAYNNTDGTDASASVTVKSATSSGSLAALPSTYTGGLGSTSQDYIGVLANSDAAGVIVGAGSTGQLVRFFAGSNTEAMRVSAKSVAVGSGGALATDATDGFLYIPTCAGTPTGVPTAITGTVPIVYDSTNNKLYIYDGSWLGGTSPGAFT